MGRPGDPPTGREARSGREVFKGKIKSSSSFSPPVYPAAEVPGCRPRPAPGRAGILCPSEPQSPPPPPPTQLTLPGDCGARGNAARPAVAFRPGSRAKGCLRSRPPSAAGEDRLPDPRAAPLRPHPGLASRGTGGELRAEPSGWGWRARAASPGRTEMQGKKTANNTLI